jgi:thioredoxin reductase (NADPH)
VHFCATCDGPFYEGAQELLVVGGGNSGVEEGLFLAQFADRVRLIEYMPELKASALLQEKIRNDPRFIIQTNTEILELRKGGDGRLGTVVARDRATGDTQELTPAGVFVFIGLDPNTAFLRGVVELDRFGFVVTDDGFRTSMPGVFAAGDVRAGSTKQLGAATGEGISALLQVRDHLRELEAAVPTAEVATIP